MSTSEPPGASAAPEPAAEQADWFAAPPEHGEPDDIWSKQDKRHPELLALACIATANALVSAIWHGSYPHQPGGCHQGVCGLPLWASMKNRGSPAVGIIIWRRDALYGGGGLEHDTIASEHAARLAEDAALWDLGIDLERALADLRRMARTLGLPIADPSPLEHTRAYTGSLLAELMGRPLPVRVPRDIAVPDTASMLVQLRRALARAHQLAQQSTRLHSGVPAAWLPYVHAFGPRYTTDAVAFHKAVVARYDQTRRRVREAMARGVDSLTAVQRYELLCDQQHLDLLAEQVEQIAKLYHVRVIAQDLI